MAIPNSSDILHAIIEATPDAIFAKDLDGRYVLVNRAAARFIGLSAARSSGNTISSCTRRRPRDSSSRQIGRYWPPAKPQAFEGVATGYAGTQAYLVTKGVYRDADGRSSASTASPTT